MNLNMITLYQRSKGPPEPRPNHDNTHPACGTPNAPWWCKPSITIDGGVYIMIIIAILVGSLLTIKYRRK